MGQDNSESRQPLQRVPPVATAADSQYVPSFASFPNLPIDTPSSSSTSCQKKRRKLGDREACRSKRSKEPHRSSRVKHVRAAKPSVPRRPTASLIRPDDPFYLDLQGDTQNVTLQSLHTADIPTYRRDQNQVIGLPPSQRILRGRRPTTRNLGVEIMDSRSVLRHTASANTSRYATLAAWQRASSPENLSAAHWPNVPLPSLEETTDDVIPASSSPPAQQVLELPSSDVLHARDPVDYRSIHGMLKPPALDTNNGSTLSAQDRRVRLIHDQIGSVERALKLHPADVTMWRRLLVLQGQLVVANDPGGAAALSGVNQRPSVKFKRTLAEIHIAVYERALSHVTNDPTFALEYLTACEDVLDFDALVQKWSRVLKTFHQSAELQLAYLNFRQTHTSGSTCLDDILKLYHQGQQRLAMMRRTGPTNGDAEMEGWQLYLFIRACMFLKEAGYTELAWAAYQAQLELTINRAHSRSVSDFTGPVWESALADIAQWWISESPRPGDCGWLHSASRNRPATSSATVESWLASITAETLPGPTLPLPHSSDYATPWAGWYESEWLADVQQHQPTKTRELSPNKPLTDPFSIPLPDEFTPLLFVAHHTSHQQTLLYVWVLFFNLPFRPPGWTSRHPWQADPFLGLSGSIDAITLAGWPNHQRDNHSGVLQGTAALPICSDGNATATPAASSAMSVAVCEYTEFWGKLLKPSLRASTEHGTSAQFDSLPFCLDNTSQPLIPLGLAYLPPDPLSDINHQPFQDSDQTQPLIRSNFGRRWLSAMGPHHSQTHIASSRFLRLTSQLADHSLPGQGALLLTLLRWLGDQISPPQVLKASKRLLKQNDTRPELWLYHARLEAQRHHTNACRKLYATVTTAWHSEPNANFTNLVDYLLVLQEWCEWELGLATATTNSQLVVTLGANPTLATTCVSYLMSTDATNAEAHLAPPWESLVHTAASATREFYQQCLKRCTETLHALWKPSQESMPTPLGPGLPLTRAMTGYATALSIWGWWLWGTQRFSNAHQLFTSTLAHIEEIAPISADLDQLGVPP
ncbi:hypothetical protein H4R34_004468, partial [Dimargaris verticillata]